MKVARQRLSNQGIAGPRARLLRRSLPFVSRLATSGGLYLSGHQAEILNGFSRTTSDMWQYSG